MTSDSDTRERRNPENVGKDSPIASVRGILSYMSRGGNDSAVERERKINSKTKVGAPASNRKEDTPSDLPEGRFSWLG